MFGILKRQWGMTHTIVKGKKNVESEYRLAALAYNLLRLVNIKGMKWLQKKLKSVYKGIYWTVIHNYASQYDINRFEDRYYNPNMMLCRA